jgi:hypothetical protein
MAQLLIRNIEESVRDRLQARARRHGNSMAKELRDILQAAAELEQAREDRGDMKLGTWMVSLFDGQGREGDFPEMHGEPVRPARFEP